MDENKVYEAMGLEPPAEDGKDVPDNGEQETTLEGEVTPPAEGGPEREDPPMEEETSAEEGTSGEEPEEPVKGQEPAGEAAPGQSAIDAAVQAALEAERARQQQTLDQFFAGAKLKNTVTGEPITSMDEYQQWQKSYADEQLRRELEAGRLTPESLERAIAANPAVQRAQEVMQQQEALRQQEEQRAIQARIDAEIAEIGRLDPSIHSAEDLLQMPTGQAFYDYVKKGNSFLDAYRLANFDALTQRAVENARRQALSSVQGKKHLTPAPQARGEGAPAISADELDMFRAIMPEVKEADAAAYYQNYLKGEGQ